MVEKFFKLKPNGVESLLLPKIIFLFFFFSLFAVISLNPLVTPVTDDWLFYPWQIRQESPGGRDDLELFIGQQQVIVKYLLYFSSFIPFLAAPYTGLINLFFAVTGIALLIKSQIRFGKGLITPMAASAIVVACFSFKPLYMYFMATSIGSMVAILLLGIYFYIKNSDNPNNWYLLPVLFISPFSFGTGIIIILCEWIELTYKVFKKKIRWNSRYLPLMAITTLTSLFLSQVLPSIQDNYNFAAGGKPVSPTLGIFQALTDPINSIKFIVISAGNIFVPSSRFDPTLPLIAGIVFLFVLFIALWQQRASFSISPFLENKNCMMAGVLFIALTLLARGVGAAQGYSAATAPRYITGTFLFTVGAIVFISTGKNKMFIRVFCLVVILSISISGFKTGSEWLMVRKSQTQALLDCLNGNSMTKIVVGDRCFVIAEKIRNPVTDSVFEDQLNNFNLNRY